MSWYQLLDIMAEARALAQEDKVRHRMACPNDGTPYLTAPDGSLRCPFDGYSPDAAFSAV